MGRALTANCAFSRLQNPLLARAVVTDESGHSRKVAAETPAPAAAPGASGDMGQALSGPVVLGRHHRVQPAPARRRIPLEKGYSQMDWVQRMRTRKDMAGEAGVGVHL